MVGPGRPSRAATSRGVLDRRSGLSLSVPGRTQAFNLSGNDRVWPTNLVTTSLLFVTFGDAGGRAS